MLKKSACLLVFVLLFCSFISAEMNYGQLNIFSKSGKHKIFLDEEEVGITPVKLDKVLAGSHILRALDTKSLRPVLEQTIVVNDGELTTIIVGGEAPAKTYEGKALNLTKTYGPKIYAYSNTLTQSISGFSVSASGTGLGVGFEWSGPISEQIITAGEVGYISTTCSNSSSPLTTIILGGSGTYRFGMSEIVPFVGGGIFYARNSYTAVSGDNKSGDGIGFKIFTGLDFDALFLKASYSTNSFDIDSSGTAIKSTLSGFGIEGGLKFSL